MPIFELEKDELLDLTEGQLEELVARLCEAEVAQAGHAVSCVRWMGALTAADGGIDVQVVVPDEHFRGDFVPRAATVFQVKKSSMPPFKISEEMTGKDNAKVLFDHLNTVSGAFVIVSLGDDNAPPNHKLRTDKMEEELSTLVSSPVVHVDFYNRSRLAQWLRQHVSVQLWVRKTLGKSLSCWRPLEKWTATPSGEDDSVIFQDGISVVVPGQSAGLCLADAIPAARVLIRSTSKAIRVAGLSGVGKTRFVQALFEDVGDGDPLDRTKVVYADIGEGPNPSAANLLDTLIADQLDAILVLDNCPSDLHGVLAGRLAKSDSPIKLVTVEYDIREDKPQTTEVVRIKAHGPEIAESLVARRFPKFVGPNARRIGEFAEGNCRLALALADAVPEGDSLADLSDDQLFERLFHQRHDLDKDLKEQAEALSLVYSFSVEQEEEGVDELAVLGSLCEKTRHRMHRVAQTLVDRQIAQKRGRWRAVLPHAIANRLAADALRNIPEAEIIETFETEAGPRLLKSFGRRLGYLHDHDVAERIVAQWLRDGGLLNRIINLDEHGAEMLMHVAPVAPDSVLQMIEAQIEDIVLAISRKRYHPIRANVITLLMKVAYDPNLFERSILLLLKIAIEEENSNLRGDVVSKIRSFFGLVYSGTHATLEQRLAFLEHCLDNDDPRIVEICLSLPTETLRTERFSTANTSDFGARPRDYGMSPTYEESIRWFEAFLAFVTGLASGEDVKKKRVARNVLAERFRELWRLQELRETLVETGRELNAKSPWFEGWRAVRSILHTDRISTKKRISADQRTLLEALESELRPNDLEGRIRALVLSDGRKIFSIDDEFDPDEPEKYERSRERQANQAFELGRDCNAERGLFDRIAGELFEPKYGPYRQHFGRGLIVGSSDARAVWDQLVAELKAKGVEHFDYGVLVGVLQAIAATDRSVAKQILDECANDELLRNYIVVLYPDEGFDEVDFDRCLSVLSQTGLPLMGINDLLWRPKFDVVSDKKKIKLSEMILAAEGGPIELLDAYSMKLHGKDCNVDILGPEQRRLGLVAAAAAISTSDSGLGGSEDDDMQQVLRACLSFDENEEEKDILIGSLFERVANSYGFFSDFERAIQVIAELLPIAFLERALLDTSIDEYKRFGLFRNSVHEVPPLVGIPPKQLVEWCQEGNDPQRWNLLARAISPFEKADSEAISLTKQAAAILEASPDPNLVVDGFFENLSPSSWSGSLADLVTERAAAMFTFQTHERAEIRDAAASFLEKAKELEEREREWEVQQNNTVNVSFE